MATPPLPSSATPQPDTVRLGTFGVVLNRAIDALKPGELARCTNLVFDAEGAATTRLGLTALATGGTAYHSVARLNDPSGAAPKLIWGIDTSVYYGLSGALTAAEAGFSGNPLALVQYRPPNSGQTWMYVADSAKLRKINAAGLILPVGLPAPTAPTTALDTELTVAIEDFENGFTARTGTGGAPVLTYPAAKVNNGLNILTAVGAATTGYTSWADKGFGAVDLTTFGGGVAATDDDLLHLWLKVDRPDLLAEIRVYLVSGTFTGGVVPGTSTTQNQNAYVKSFRSSDITSFVEQSAVAVPTSVGLSLARKVLVDSAVARALKTSTIVGNATSKELAVGRGAWLEYGVVGQALRRSDFDAIGSPTWSSIQGIIVWVLTTGPQAINVTIDNLFLRGGRGLDSAEVGAQPYDYRVTNYDPRTGAESNPSPEQVVANHLDSLRRAIVVDPAAYGDANIRQRVYRRGGSVSDNWYFVGVNAADGGTYQDLLSDETTVTAGAVEIDHDQPVTTLNASGADVLASPAYALWGPAADFLFLCGDPYRAGHVYTCKQGEPDHWPAANAYEVCSPAEELMNGCIWADQSYVFSRKRLYRLYLNLSGSGGVTPVPTGCEKGLAGRWALATTSYGIAFVADDNVYVTFGGEATPLADDLRPLFNGETVNGYLPISFSVPAALRLWSWEHYLYFTYRDTGGVNQTWRYSFRSKTWLHHSFGASQIAFGYSHELAGAGASLLLLGRSSGKAYTHSGTSDDGAAIAWVLRTGALDQGAPELDKLYHQIRFDLDRAGTTVTLTPSINNEGTALAGQAYSTGSGRTPYLYEFATNPQRGRNLSLHWSGTATAARPVLYFATIFATVEPAQLTTAGITWEDLGDTYYTGLDLDVDTFNTAKEVKVYVDQVLVGTFTVTANGRSFIHLTLTPGRGHLYRFVATEATPWIVYGHRWQVEAEPSEQTNWNQNFSVHGTRADKWLKGIIFECDTYGANKTVQVEVDGVVVETLTVTAQGRKVVQKTLAAQQLGRVWRLLPSDANPGRLYSVQPVFDEEPLALDRWETQETDHGLRAYHLVRGLYVTVNSAAQVTLTISVYADDGTLSATLTDTLPATGGVKQKQQVHPTAARGVLFKYLLTSTQPFRLYREESHAEVVSWTGVPVTAHPFGNDDLDPTRHMGRAALSAAIAGGQA